MSVLIVSKDKASLALKVGQTPAGARGLTGERGERGLQGEQGVQGEAFVYTDFTPEQLADLKGDKGDKGDKGNAFVYADFTAAQLASLKGDQGDPVPITTSLGQSATQAVSQKLLTDEIANMNNTLGNIGAALNNINGV